MAGILVRFRFDGDMKSQVGRFTYEQYLNLKSLPITAECKIVSSAKNVLSDEDVKIINARIRRIKNSKSHTKKLSED